MSYKYFLKPNRFSTALAIAFVLGGATQLVRAEGDSPDKQFVVVVNNADDEGAVEDSPAKFWLGILLKEVEGDLATYLGTDQGVLVDSVFPDSPAEAAGLEKGDILLKIGDEELAGPADLLAAMQELKVDDDKPSTLALTLLRKGEEVKVDLTPAPRPQEAEAKAVLEVHLDAADADKAEVDEAKAFSFSFSGDMPTEEMKVLLEKINQGNFDSDVKVFRLGNPYLLWSQAEADQAAVEHEGEMTVVVKKDVDGKKLEVTIKRTDDKPAKITVKSGDETQEYSEEELEEMPEETRKIVATILNNKLQRFNVKGFDSDSVISGLREAVKGQQALLSKKAVEALWESKADALRAKALESAKGAREMAAAARDKVNALAKESAEVDELKKLIQELRSEVDQLRKQIDRPE
jgi:hypothetical protein